MGKKRTEATVLFYPGSDGEGWVAHCLDFDLVGTGDDLHEAFEDLLGALEAQLEFWGEVGDRAAPARPAPRAYWEALKRAIPLPTLAMHLERPAESLKRRRSAGVPEVASACKAAMLTAALP